jgi:hypothetical protein
MLIGKHFTNSRISLLPSCYWFNNHFFIGLTDTAESVAKIATDEIMTVDFFFIIFSS